MIKELDGKLLLEMLRSGQANLANRQKDINALNVFPVPDGDTGTNMSMTFTNGLKEAEKLSGQGVSEIAKALSKGLLMGARGNSGVITSQIFRGFYQALEGKQTASVAEVALAFENGARVAYKAIMKPVEGTILTVVREGAWYANHYVEKHPATSLEEYFTRLVQFSRESLAKTPDLLPVLKEVGVVDSGGAGLCLIFEGMEAVLRGQSFVLQSIEEKPEDDYEQHIAALDLANDEFGYCTEFILRLAPEERDCFDEEVLKSKLTIMGGNSLVCARDGDLVKVHVHTLHPGEALNIGQRFGDFIKLKIENMQEQRRVIEEEAKERARKQAKVHKKYGLITVAAGEGLHRVFKECRADVVIHGGQTMNPSTEDFDREIKGLDVDHIFILPNNGNIILAANQAKQLHPELDIHVLESRTIPEGIAALSLFNPEAEVDENLSEMKTAISHVDSGSLTYAIKDTSLNGVAVKEGDYLAMTEKKIVSSGQDKMFVLKKLLDKMLQKEEAELLTLIVGAGNETSEVEEVKAYIAEHSDVEIYTIQGDQPVYMYLVGIE